MLSKSQEIFAVVAHSENTPELEDFWLSRYTHYLSQTYFDLHPNTASALTEQSLPGPLTPLGEIKLSPLLTPQNTIDTSKLQEVLYIAVRFLDGCLDTFPFTDSAKKTVAQYRKIGIGLTDIESFLDSKNTVDKQSLINALGEQFCKLVYRASEALAEEKGAYTDFALNKKTLLPKSFIRWINQDTGTLSDGYALSSQTTQAQLELESWEQIPRRNSHLLALPNSNSWNQWSDRQEDLTQDKPVDLPTKKSTDTQPKSPKAEHRFELGELVKITKKDSVWYSRVGQISEHIDGPVAQVKLASLDKTIESLEWIESDIGVIDTAEVITKLDQFVRVDLQVVVFNQTKKRVYVDLDNCIPSITILPFVSIDQTLSKLFTGLYTEFVDITNWQIVAVKTRPEKRTIELVLIVSAVVPTNSISQAVDSDQFSVANKTILKEALAFGEQIERHRSKIELLESKLSEQKTLNQIVERESAEIVWLRQFPKMEGVHTVTMESGYKMEVVLSVELGKPSGLTLRAVGQVPSSIVTIMKLVELTVSGKIRDTTQFAASLSGLATVARSTSDTMTLEILTIVASTLGVSIDQKGLI